MLDEELGPSSAEVAGEDFLFHLYRGSELLQDNRVHEAKQELEHALALQPLDPEGQDLLAIVYFRLGLYPRAITIYIDILAAYPQATTPRINLALCYLKTGQPAAARTELERVIEKDPSHARAWGYLGLAFQRLGDVERALHAFQAGGHHQMARRLLEAAPVPSQRPTRTPEREVASVAAGFAFDELDKRDIQSLRPDTPTTGTPHLGNWAALEPGRESYAPERRSYSGMALPSESLVPPASLGPIQPLSRAELLQQGLIANVTLPPLSPLPRAPSERPPSVPPSVRMQSQPPLHLPPRTANDLAREHLLVFPRGHRTAQHPSGTVLLRGSPNRGEEPFPGLAVRLDSVRAASFAGGYSSRALFRRMRGKDTEEPLGGTSSPLVVLDGIGHVVVGPSPGTKLAAIALGDEPIFFRETAIIALEGDLLYENGRLPVGEGDSIPIVQLRGPGSVTVALPQALLALEVEVGRTLYARGHAVLGWTGRVVPRALSFAEAPNRVRGLVSATGEGTLFLDGR